MGFILSLLQQKNWLMLPQAVRTCESRQRGSHASSRPILLPWKSPKWLLLIPFVARAVINLLQNQTLSCHLQGIWEQIAVCYRICSSVLINLGCEVCGFGPCFLKSEPTQSFESISASAAEALISASGLLESPEVRWISKIVVCWKAPLKGMNLKENEMAGRPSCTPTRFAVVLCAHSELCSASKTRYQIHVNPIG